MPETAPEDIAEELSPDDGDDGDDGPEDLASALDDLAGRYFLDLAAAFVRGRRPDAPDLPADELGSVTKPRGCHAKWSPVRSSSVTVGEPSASCGNWRKNV